MWVVCAPASAPASAKSAAASEAFIARRIREAPPNSDTRLRHGLLRVFGNFLDDEHVADGKAVQWAIARRDCDVRPGVAGHLEHIAEPLSGQNGEPPTAKLIRCRRRASRADGLRLKRVNAALPVRIAQSRDHPGVSAQRWIDNDVVMTDSAQFRRPGVPVALRPGRG